MTKIHVNAKQWNGISAEEKKAIVSGLRKVGSLGQHDEIVADEKSKPVRIPKTEKAKKAKSAHLCKLACEAAAASAAAWCDANTVGAGYVACMAAAQVACDECIKKCG